MPTSSLDQAVCHTQHHETAAFTVLVGDTSVSKACVSLGDDEPLGTSPGSSSKQRFQRSTRVKKGHMLHEGSLACGLCSSLTQQTLSIFGKDMHSQDHFIFPSLCWQFPHCCTSLMTAQIGRDHRFNRKFSLTLPRTVPRDERQGQSISGSCITHWGKGFSGKKRRT